MDRTTSEKSSFKSPSFSVGNVKTVLEDLPKENNFVERWQPTIKYQIAASPTTEIQNLWCLLGNGNSLEDEEFSI